MPVSARHSEEPNEPTDSAASTAPTYAADDRQALAAAEASAKAAVMVHEPTILIGDFFFGKHF